jgi:hypothetical protein
MMGGVVSDVGNFLQDNVVTPISDLGVSVDQGVNSAVPGGWGTVGAITAALVTAGASIPASTAEFIAADAASLASSGLSEAAIAQNLAASYGISAEAASAAASAALGTGSGVASAATSLTSMIGTDAANLASQGLSQSQIAEILGQSYGIDAYAAANAAGIAAAGGTAESIAGTLAADYGTEMAGLAQEAGISNSTLGSLVKQYGTQAVKSLLGNQVVSKLTGAGTGTGAGGLLGAAGNYLLTTEQLNRLQNAYNQNVVGQQTATKLAQQQASFTPVGMTTAFGTSNFQYDPVTGKLTSAGYTASPELAAQRDKLFGLGSQALPTTADTAQIQQDYIAQQQGLLAPGREQELAQLRNRLYQRGTSGLATGGTQAGYAPNASGLLATNPELAALYNARGQQDAAIAANAPVYAQNLLNQQIATGTGLFGAANTLEQYAQQPLTLASSLGTAGSTAGYRAGYYGLLGNQAALQTQLQGQQANIYGTGQALSTASQPLFNAAGNIIGNWLS